jgi:hypothetical protein
MRMFSQVACGGLFLVLSQGCSFRSLDPINEGNAGAGGSSAEAGSSAKGGTGGTGGSSKGGSSSTESAGGSSLGGSGGAGGISGTSATGGANAMGGTSTLSGGTQGTSTGGDTTPPMVVSVTPSNGTTGVKSDAKIVITFSEAMDKASVKSALAVPPLAIDGFTVAWSSNDSVLTVTPTASLAYATGASASATAALSYTVALSTSAKDVAGNPLISGHNSAFSTLRRITHTATPTIVQEHDTFYTVPRTCSSGTLSLLASPEMYQIVKYAYVTFDLSSVASQIPAAGIETASFRAVQGASTSGYYLTKTVALQAAEYQIIGELTKNENVVCTDLGTLSNSAASQVSLAVTSALVTELAANRSKLLYRLAPAGPMASEQALFDCAQFRLDITYLTP